MGLELQLWLYPMQHISTSMLYMVYIFEKWINYQ